MKKELNKKIEIIIYGFAAGVMMAALVWSLIIPAIESSSIIPVVIGLILGVGTFYFIDYYLILITISSSIAPAKLKASINFWLFERQTKLQLNCFAIVVAKFFALVFPVDNVIIF